jgi:hypothetical protein
MRRKLAAIAVVVLVLAAGGAYAAASSGSGSNPRDAFLADAAKRLGVSTATLQAALRGAFDDQLSAAVSAGKLTQAQANAIEQRSANGGLPLPGMAFGMTAASGMPAAPGAGPSWAFKHRPPFPNGMPSAPGAPGAAPLIPGLKLRGSSRLHGGFNSAAQYLGLTPAKLLSELRAGRTLAQITAAQGKSLAGLNASLAQSLRQRLERAVSAGLLTQKQAQQILARRAAKRATLLGAP